MAKSLIAPGAILDSFTIGECVHHGGMATLWSVTHAEVATPLLMTGINQVDHIIIGARENSTLRSLLGSVSSKVASEARCTVTVVRPPRVAGAAFAPDDRDMPPVF